MRLFDIVNPNYDIFEIPPEEGGVEDDNYLGSIGDAVQKHVGNLSHGQRQAWEDLYHTPDGNIFRVVPNWNYEEKDPFNLKGKELDEYFLELVQQGVSEETLANVKEAIEKEQEDRANSEDIMDQGQLIPYHEWEKFPQMWNHYEMPTTPKDRYIYMGNTKQTFYDQIPDDIPEKDKLNMFLHIVNNDNIYDEQTMWSITKWAETNINSPFMYKAIIHSLEKIVTDKENPQEVIEKALGFLDHVSRNFFFSVVFGKAKKDKYYLLLKQNEQDFEKLHKQGNHVFNDVLRLGARLFTDHKSALNGHHWRMYHRLKEKYAPKIMLNNYDLNRCRRPELQRVLNLTDRQTRDLWLDRPFRNLAEIYNKGYVTKKNLSSSSKGEQVFDWLQKCYDRALEKHKYSILKAASNKMTQAEKENKIGIEQDEWKKIWAFFTILKNNFQIELEKQAMRNKNERV